MRIPLYMARLFKPELLVTSFCFLLPDLVDKPLWMLGAIPNGRDIGHTLLLVFLVSALFSIKRRSYGLFALCGGMLHLLSDIGGFIPWLYPFKGYDLPDTSYHGIVTFTNTLETLGEMVLADIVVLVVMGVVLWMMQRCTLRGHRVGQSNETSDQP